MKLTKVGNLMVLGLALTVLAVGCKKRPIGVTNLPGSRSGIGESKPLETAPPISLPPPLINGETTPKFGETGIAPNEPSHTGWKENADALKASSVYFEFDKSSIKSSEQPKLSEVASYLKSNGNAAVRVEGNCDERGTEEYNRSLGERRALAAREALVGMGIDPRRVDTVSYGEDKPAVQGHDESAFSKNRRDDFIVLTPP
ncbi:MAG: peptidoglycan-binding outer rane lipoprotein Pal, OmpA family [Pedosphaera sp.]|nr:peptidoglycan-binding outer rane lipoprotein Pal, OmpA family [Pedosphaera sp.]